jgi:hypothetical protein
MKLAHSKAWPGSGARHRPSQATTERRILDPMRTVGLLACVAVGSLSACEPPPVTHSAEWDMYRSFRTRVDEVNRKRQMELIWPVCENPPKAGRCGLLWEEWTHGDRVEHFVQEHCHEDDPSEISDACTALFRDGFKASLRRTYTWALESDVQRTCEDNPEKCANAGLEEVQWLISHDARINAFYDSTVNDFIRRYHEGQRVEAGARQAAEQQEAQDEQRRRAALHAFGAGLQAAGRAYSATPTTTYVPHVQTVRAPGSCSSDFECGGPGFVCVKPGGRTAGTCARAVNQYGNQDYQHSPRLDSVGPGQAECSLSKACPMLFRCIEDHCMRQ